MSVGLPKVNANGAYRASCDDPVQCGNRDSRVDSKAFLQEASAELNHIFVPAALLHISHS